MTNPDGTLATTLTDLGHISAAEREEPIQKPRHRAPQETRQLLTLRDYCVGF
jgi:hypothetical protein